MLREVLLYYCQLFLSCYFYSGATPLLADQASPNLSISFHPLKIFACKNFNFHCEAMKISLLTKSEISLRRNITSQSDISLIPLLEFSFNHSVCALFGFNCSLIIQLFTLAKPDFQLCSAVFDIHLKRNYG